MRITLIHNPAAGGGEPDAKMLRKLIKAAGHKVTYHSSKEKGLGAILEQRADLVVVAAGDGTVGRVARRMVGHDTPIAVLPLGTANNIAHSLGIADMDPAKLIAGWEKAKRVRFDSGKAKGPWGKRRFVEGLGVGLFAWTMPQAADSKALDKIEDPQDAVAHVLKMLQDRLEHYKAHELRATLDDQDLSGSYVMFEAINLQYIGPNLHLAPGVKPGDGKLHVVAVTEAERDKLYKYLGHWQKGKAPTVDLPTYEGKRLKIERGDYEVHLDDRIWPDPKKKKEDLRARDIEVKIKPGTLEFLVPAEKK
jgi:diacylglycerol kinase family enzyme